MLKDGVVLMVICLIGVGGLAVWWTRTSTSPITATASQVQAPAAVPAAAAPAVKKVVRPKPAPPPVVEQPVAVVVPVAPASPVVQVPPPPFPAVEQIANGAHVDAITNKYGDPSLSTVTFADGHLVETFVYSRNRGRNATVIRLEDGKVATAYSQTEPLVPHGLSAPARFHNQ